MVDLGENFEKNSFGFSLNGKVLIFFYNHFNNTTIMTLPLLVMANGSVGLGHGISNTI